MTKSSSKDKTKNGSSSLFAAYLANMNMPLGSISKGVKVDLKDRERSSKVNFDTILSKDLPFPDNMTAELLIRYIATEHEWFEDQTKSDISILIKNRLSTVKDLRVLSKESWKQLELLPFTKDLLREAISRGKLSAEEEYLKKKEREKRKERRLSRETIVSVNNTNRNSTNTNKNDMTNNFKKEAMDPTSPLSSIKPSPSSKNEPSNKLEVTKHPIRSSSQSQSQQSPKDLYQIKHNNINNIKNSLPIEKIALSITDPVSKLDNIKRFMPEPNKMLVGENRLKIRTDDGKFYEIDRYCPHAGSDLFSRGAIVGSKIVCSKHYWTFSLEEGGNCLSGGKGSINACSVNDW